MIFIIVMTCFQPGEFQRYLIHRIEKKEKGIYLFVNATRHSTNKKDSVLCIYVCNELLELDKQEIINKQFKIENIKSNLLNYLNVFEIDIGESVLESF